jgi:hypothetical protein
MSILRENIPAELSEPKQWVGWKRELRDGRSTKVPYTSEGFRASATNPAHWNTLEGALRFVARWGFDGIGFVFTSQDSYTGMDLDKVWLHETDEGASWAAGILERFGDTYGEASPSDQGFKIWSKAKAPRCGRWPIGAGAIEIYDHARFFTVTGRSNGVTVITDHQADIEALVAHLDSGRRHYHQPQRGPQVMSGPIPQGQRHNTLVSLAGSMYRRGMTPDAIEAALLVTNERQCDPPYLPEHVRKIVSSTWRWQQ